MHTDINFIGTSQARCLFCLWGDNFCAICYMHSLISIIC